jgi:hypothetical protein
MNPLDMIKSFMSGGKNAEQIAMQLIGNSNNPFMNNLVNMAKKGDYQGVENIARNMFKEQGRDFDKEMKDLQGFIQNFK